MKLAASVSVIAICALTSIAARADDSDKQNRYVMTPLTSDLPDTAPNQDPVLQNAWGVAFTPGGSPFWIADNATGCSTLYDGAGVPTGGSPPLKVKIPLPSGQPSATSCMTVPPNANPAPTNAAPTGMVWNPTSTFVVPGQQTPAGAPIPAAFIWATEDGTISAWAGGLTPPDQAVLAVDNSGSGAVYKGLVFGTNPRGVFLFATDFHNAKIDVFAPNPAGLTGYSRQRTARRSPAPLLTPKFRTVLPRLASRTSTVISLSPMQNKNCRINTMTRPAQAMALLIFLTPAGI